MRTDAVISTPLVGGGGVHLASVTERSEQTTGPSHIVTARQGRGGAGETAFRAGSQAEVCM